MRGGEHSGESGQGEMDRVYRELDRLFEEYWHDTEPSKLLSKRGTRQQEVSARPACKPVAREDDS